MLVIEKLASACHVEGYYKSECEETHRKIARGAKSVLVIQSDQRERSVNFIMV